MNLENFVKQTLLEILNGVRSANREFLESESDPGGTKPFLLVPGSSGNGSGIDFDVAVIAKTEGAGKAAVKVNLAVVEAELGADGGITKDSISRVKFRIDIHQYRG